MANDDGGLTITINPRFAAAGTFLLLAVYGTWNAAVSARSILAMAIAAVVIAGLVSGPVQALDKHVPRPVAMLLAVLLLGVGVGGVVYAAYDDLDAAFAQLQESAPKAAADLEDSERFGEIATDLRLEERVTSAVDRLRDNAQDRAQATALRFVNYFVGLILAIFFLVYGPRIFEGALRQVDDDERRARIARVTYRAIEESRTYLGLEILNSLVVGTIGYLVCWWLDLPGAVALGLVLGLGAMIPDVGIVVGATPALLLTAAAHEYKHFVAVLLGVLVLQGIDSYFSHRRLVRTVDVGPAVSLLSVLLGFAVYGVGGAIFGFAIAVFLSAVIDSLGKEIDGELGDEAPPVVQRLSAEGS